jgi:hypothetical protein
MAESKHRPTPIGDESLQTDHFAVGLRPYWPLADEIKR